ncbi:hypothetical protein [Pyrobaculum sp.]|uniref:hypothetical protein n=1 Tax=Pyrobaculum sp. TaxID=2004705 RepID=UPI00316A0C05
MRSGLLALAVLLAVLAVAAPPDAAMENRPIILHAYVCLNASEVGNVYNAAFASTLTGKASAQPPSTWRGRWCPPSTPTSLTSSTQWWRLESRRRYA